MQPCFLLSMLFVLATLAPAQAEELVRGSLGTRQITARVPIQDLQRQKKWNGSINDVPPLKAEEALRIARHAAGSRYPKLRSMLLMASLELRQCSTQLLQDGEVDTTLSPWLYCVRYAYVPPASDHPTFERIDIPVIVLMDGSVYVAAERSKTIP
jgi:hypothetical protein